MSKNRINTSVSVAIVLMLFTAVMVAIWRNNERSLGVPADYQPLAELDLRDGPFAEMVVGEFAVGATAVTHLHLSLQNLNTPLFTLRLQDENGPTYTILHAENYRTNRDGGGDWQETLLPGRYQLRLTAAQGSGLVTVYLQNTD